MPDPPSSSVSRRLFTTTAVGALAGTILSRSAGARPTASDQIGLGIVGLGSRGFNLIDEFLQLPTCRIVAICDVDNFHYRDQPWGRGKAYGREPAETHITNAYSAEKSGTASRGLQVFSDYRELLARPDVDAVVVATPDHWHAACTLAALRAGKDVYCEKPVTHLFAEGQAVAAEVARQQAVFQTGSQQRSDPLFQTVVELTRNRLLGDIRTIEVGLPPGYEKPQGSTAIQSPRAGLDYDFWCGPSEKLPLMQARHHRWWRGHRAFGGGVLMDWIGHHNDIAHWAIGAERSGPEEVETTEWLLPETDVYNTPRHYTIRCVYNGGITSTISSRNRQGLKIVGSEGWVYARRGVIEASEPRWLQPGFAPGPIRVNKPQSHAADFLERIRDRGECIAPAEIGHRSITPGHLGYVSFAVQQPLRWDAQQEQITDHAAADALLRQVTYRSPWTWPII